MTKEELRQQQLMYEEWRKRIFKHQVRTLKERNDIALVFKINNFLFNGIGSSDEIKQIIAYLIGEYGEGFFNSEQLKYFLKKEESDYEDEEVDYAEYAEAFPENEEYKKLANLQLLNS